MYIDKNKMLNVNYLVRKYLEIQHKSIIAEIRKGCEIDGKIRKVNKKVMIPMTYTLKRLASKSDCELQNSQS